MISIKDCDVRCFTMETGRDQLCSMTAQLDREPMVLPSTQLLWLTNQKGLLGGL